MKKTSGSPSPKFSFAQSTNHHQKNKNVFTPLLFSFRTNGGGGEQAQRVLLLSC
jgi:hypothetical protein|tara:strand:- start:233 stop:394 length:162 start_codon:yes stop_codon:yes gene_type:complete